MGANVLVEFENVFLIGGIFFYNLGPKIYFGIEKISYFGNYMDPCKIRVTKSCVHQDFNNNDFEIVNSSNLILHII